MTEPCLGLGEEQYRVPKLPVTVELMLEGGETLRGDIYVLPQGPRPDSRERICDVFEAPEAFVPVATAAGVVLVHKTRAVLVRVADGHDAGLIDDELLDAPLIPVEIALRGAPAWCETLGASIRIEGPRGHARLIDFLDGPRPFLALYTENGPALLNVRHVLTVRPL